MNESNQESSNFNSEYWLFPCYLQKDGKPNHSAEITMFLKLIFFK